MDQECIVWLIITGGTGLRIRAYRNAGLPDMPCQRTISQKHYPDAG